VRLSLGQPLLPVGVEPGQNGPDERRDGDRGSDDLKGVDRDPATRYLYLHGVTV
jgi:hypothetical protein